MGLRTKFLLPVIAVSALLTTGALLVMRQSVHDHVTAELATSLDNSALTYRQLQRRRESQAQRSAQFLADLPVLKAVLTTGDPATIQDTSSDLWKTSGADLLAVADASGRLMALHSSGEVLSRSAGERFLRQALSPFHPVDWWDSGVVYQVFLQPVYAGNSGERRLLGVLALGYAWDINLVQETARLADGPVAFRVGDRIVASTLEPRQQGDLQAQLAHAGHTLAGAHELRLGGERFVGAQVPLSADGVVPIELILLKSYDRATTFLNRINLQVAIVGGTTILLGSLLVLLISHRVTQPLAELLVGVRALAKGDFSYPLRSSSRHGEVAELTAAFDNMRRGLEHSQVRTVNAARMEAVGQLAGGVAHDFNNFVTIIKGYSDLLREHVGEAEPARNFLEQIKQAADRAAAVTRQLLAFSRKQVFQPQVLDLNAVCANLSRMLRVLIGEDIEVKITSEAGLRKVLADPCHIEQVIMNLAVNARDAMPKGGKLLIETTNADVPSPPGEAPPVKAYVKLAVSDTGCGMSKELMEKVFLPFFTTKESGKGTGLGLSIVEGIVKKSGGFLSAASEVGRGTTFNIFFPEAEVAAAAPVEESTAPRLEVAGSEAILVVEDEDALRALARESLRMRGYRVVDATNGADALSKLASCGGKIDLVLTDVVMPGMGGIELAAKIREQYPRTTILLMSGYTDRVGELEQSNLLLLQKPFTPEQLVERVAEVLLARQQEAATAGMV